MVRSANGDGEHVLVIGGVSGLVAGPRRRRRRRAKAARATEAVPPVPVTRLTVVNPGAFADEAAAERWLREVESSAERSDGIVEDAVRILNRMLHAHRIATQDPHGPGASSALALARRIGFGTGDELAEGRWSDAIDVPPAPGPRGRVDALRPQERMAAALGRREEVDACETLVLRARADLDGERPREAALQLRVALEALLAEVEAEPLPQAAKGQDALAADQAAAQLADLERLGERRRITGEAANEALAGELSQARAEEVAETLRLCERVLRRRRVLAP